MAYIQGTVTAEAQSGSTAEVTLNGVTPGNTLVLVTRFLSSNRNVTGVAGGGTWVSAVPRYSGAIRMHWCKEATGGNTTVTATFDTDAATTIFLALLEYDQLDAFLDESGLGFGTTLSSPQSTGTVDAGEGQARLIAVELTTTPSRPLSSPASGWDLRIDATNVSQQLRVLDSLVVGADETAYSMAWTGGNSNGGVALAAFSEPAGGPRVRLRWTATLAISEGIDVVGAATAHEALSDDDDDSYVERPGAAE